MWVYVPFLWYVLQVSSKTRIFVWFGWVFFFAVVSCYVSFGREGKNAVSRGRSLSLYLNVLIRWFFSSLIPERTRDLGVSGLRYQLEEINFHLQIPYLML